MNLQRVGYCLCTRYMRWVAFAEDQATSHLLWIKTCTWEVAVYQLLLRKIHTQTYFSYKSSLVQHK